MIYVGGQDLFSFVRKILSKGRNPPIDELIRWAWLVCSSYRFCYLVLDWFQFLSSV